MKIDLFDRYDIRTRLCAFLFVVSPFLLDAYILVDAIRSLSSTIIVSVVLIAGSGLAACWMRYLGNKVDQVDYITEFLAPTSTVVDAKTKERYYSKLIDIEPSFADLRSDDLLVSESTIKSISGWLKEKTRDEKFALIREENLNYGFIRNLYAVKSIFLICFTVYNILLLVLLIVSNWEISLSEYFGTIPVEHVACMIVHVVIYLAWIFAISLKILDFAAKKYAKSVVATIDRLK